MEIHVENLKIEQGSFHLEIPRIEIRSGTHVLIEGASGCGKTSLLHAIAGLLNCERGKIVIEGQSQLDRTEKQKEQLRQRKMGLILQKLHLLDSLTVEENLALGFFPDPVKPDRILHLLKKLGLDHKRDYLPQELSQGECQRVAIARALVHAPDLILADEPTSSLDDVNTERVIHLMKENSVGKTMIVVSHDHRLRPHFEAKIHFSDIVGRPL